MAALTAGRQTDKDGQYFEPDTLAYGVAAGAHIYAGAMVVLDPTTGFCKPGVAGLGLIALGAAVAEYDNTGNGASLGAGNGVAGNITATIRPGSNKYNMGGGADVITNANAGQSCYIMDDNTVGLTDGGAARSFAGIVDKVDTDGLVFVLQGLTTSIRGNAKGVFSWSQTLASVIANGDLLVTVPGFSGKLCGIEAHVTTPATTAAKLFTLTPKITATPVTGGALALTSANCTPNGALVQGAAITGANTFLASDTIKVTVSSLTAFVEGIVQINLYWN